MDNELWKPIIGFDNYYISNHGNIKSTLRESNEKILKPTKNGGVGKYFVRLLKLSDKKNYCVNVDYLVASHFVPNINEYKYIQHVNGNIFDNRAVNLQWVPGNRTKMAHKLFTDIINSMYDQGKTLKSSTQIYQILNKHNWTISDTTIRRLLKEQNIIYSKKDRCWIRQD